MAQKKKSKAKPNVVKVDIVSDIVCPWCWLGSRYFFAAAKASKHTIDVTWRPYMLDPGVPEKGVPYRDYMKSKFGDGPSNKFKAMREHLEAAAPDAGINFRFGDIPMRPNTLGAHRLMRWATGQGLGNKTAEALFKSFFDDLEDVGNFDILTRIAGEVGLDAKLVEELLSKDDDKKTIQEEIMYFRNLGVSGVPCFIYQGQFAVQGAQPPEAHGKAIEEASKVSADT